MEVETSRHCIFKELKSTIRGSDKYLLVGVDVAKNDEQEPSQGKTHVHVAQQGVLFPYTHVDQPLEEHLAHTAAPGLVEQLREQDPPEPLAALVRGDGDGHRRMRGARDHDLQRPVHAARAQPALDAADQGHGRHHPDRSARRRRARAVGRGEPDDEGPEAEGSGRVARRLSGSRRRIARHQAARAHFRSCRAMSRSRPA